MVTYEDWTGSHRNFREWVRRWAESNPGTAICDVGGGANPVLELPFRDEHRYTVVDIDPEELEKCPDDVEKLRLDLVSRDFTAPGQYDMVVSSWTAEHISDPHTFHSNVRTMLADGGRAAHFFPATGALPFLLNKYLPERVSEPIVLLTQTGRERGGTNEKFPAYYRGCRGPTQKQVAMYASCGYTIEAYNSYFGHGYYKSIPPLDKLERAKTRLLVRRPVNALVSYARVVLQAA